MDFDSIEGLCSNDIVELYDEYMVEDDTLATTFFVCACQTTRGDYGTHLKGTPTITGFCYENIDSYLVFTSTACRNKCISRYGISSIGHLFNTFGDCLTKATSCSFSSSWGTDWRCISESMVHKYCMDPHAYNSATGNAHSFVGVYWLNNTYGSCYKLRTR